MPLGFFPPAPLLSLRQDRIEKMSDRVGNAIISSKTKNKTNATAYKKAGLDPASQSHYTSDGGEPGWHQCRLMPWQSKGDTQALPPSIRKTLEHVTHHAQVLSSYWLQPSQICLLTISCSRAQTVAQSLDAETSLSLLTVPSPTKHRSKSPHSPSQNPEV